MKLRVTLTGVSRRCVPASGCGMLAGLVVDHMLFDRRRAIVLGPLRGSPPAVASFHQNQIKASIEP